MKRILTLSILVCSFLDAFSYNAEEINGFKAVFNEYPQHVPTGKTVDAPIAGNGDIGLTMAASDGRLTFYIGKNDFWKAIPSYPDGHIGLPGLLELSSPVFKDGRYYAEQLPGTAEIKATYTSEDGVLSICSWVSALDNKVVIELESTARTLLRLNLMAAEGDQSATSGGTENGCRWVSRSYEGTDLLEWPSHVAIAMNTAEDAIVLKPGEKRTVVLAVYTNHDTEQWKETAVKAALASTDDLIAETRKAHRKWWEEFWALSGISMDDPLLEQYYYQSQYIFACSSRAGKYAPGLWGPFITTDDMAWAGDYHLNYNYQGPYWASYSSNHISLTENYDQPVLDYMDKGRKHAWNLFKCRGVLYPVGLGPNGLCSSAWPVSQEKMSTWYHDCPNTIEDGAMFWQQKTNASFAAANMMMRFYSTYDEDYARKIYPFIVACAEFWEDYLTWQDGRYVVIGDVFYETAPWTDYEGDFNCAVSLGMARMTFLAADALSRFLKVDRKKRSGWNHILNHLSEFPARVNEEGRLSLDYCERDGVKPSGTNRILMHGTLLPTGLTGPYSTPEYTKAMREDIAEWKSAEGRDWGNSMGNGVETVYPGAARVGYPAAELLQHLKERIVMGSYPNCYIYADGGGLETLSAVPSTINEMMMQSYEGIIRIFPNWDLSRNGSFFNLRAYGAFLVSSSIRDGEIRTVSLLSEKGRKCVVENPWPGKSVQIVVDGKVRKRQKGRTISFMTREGRTYELRPGGK